MDSVLLESPSFSMFFPPASTSYDSVLRDSVARFLVEVRREPRDLSGLRSVFYRLLQSSPNPPLEVVWFYSAVIYRDSPAERIAAIRELFQFLTACSASYGGTRSVALLAPVVSELYKWFSDEKWGYAGASRKSVKEADGLLDGVLNFIGVCCCRMSAVGDNSCRLLPCFIDLVRVWGNDLGEFFPLVNDDVRVEIRKGGCGVLYVAGVVIAESFLMRLYLKVRNSGDFRAELSKELRIWAVSSLTAFGNPVFFEILLRVLLDRRLSFTSVCPKDEKVVLEILFDALVLVDYSFLYNGIDAERSYDQIWSLHFMRLLMTHEAIKISTDKRDHGKAISYIGAFATSFLPNELIKLVKMKVDGDKVGLPRAYTPRAFLVWLLGLESKGLKLLPDAASRLREFLVLEEPDSSPPEYTDHRKITDEELFFFDNHGDESPVGSASANEDTRAMEAPFLNAARTMVSPSGSTKKRKEWGDVGGKTDTRIKFVKYKLHDDSTKGYFGQFGSEAPSSSSEVENPASDCEMEDA